MRARPGASEYLLYSVDAGGSHTTVSINSPGGTSHTWTTESFAIASVGESVAEASLANLLTRIRSEGAEGLPALGCIASSSMPVAVEAPAPASLIEVVRRYAPPGRVVVVNDVVPLAWSPVIERAGGVVVSSGTGSSVLARDVRAGTLVKIGGHEHIVSDQGSAYSLAREGLRAAAREADGLGPPTTLREAAEAFFGRPIPALGRWLAELSRVRTVVAGFAPHVTAAAEAGDEVSRAIALAEAAALADAAEVAVARVRIGPAPAIAFAGSVLHGSVYFRNLVEYQFERRGMTGESRANVHLLDGVSAGLEFAGRLDADPGAMPDGIVLEVGSS